ncbi:hypothetical protein LVJ94_45135 [Pendulispora rubella]|uniref:Uncharacterized protein n=1 Tax=Pendulispora rubella TaxID=2741070 RepID=A0ABZ2L4E9_9BACT
MTAWSGWISVVLIVLAATLPLGQRLFAGKRAAPDSPLTRTHVVFGLLVVGIAFVHTLAIVQMLGSPAAVGGGMTALLPGGIAFFLLMAHAGLGLQLRKPRLRDRVKKRRQHLATATAIVIAIAVHVIALARH